MTTAEFKLDATLDRFARILRTSMDAPTAMVTVVRENKQEFPGASGLPPDLQAKRETPISHSLCKYVVRDQKPLIVNDLRLDENFRDHPALRDMGVTAYVGYPISDRDGRAIGSICAVDYSARNWTDRDVLALQDVALACSSDLVQREEKLQVVGILQLAMTAIVVSVLCTLLILVEDQQLRIILAVGLILPVVVVGVLVFAIRRLRHSSL